MQYVAAQRSKIDEQAKETNPCVTTLQQRRTLKIRPVDLLHSIHIGSKRLPDDHIDDKIAEDYPSDFSLRRKGILDLVSHSKFDTLMNKDTNNDY